MLTLPIFYLFDGYALPFVSCKKHWRPTPLNTEAVSLKIDANVHFFLRTMGDPDVKDAIMQELVHQMLDS